MNLVTGATGLLGSHIVEQLRLRKRPVRVLVRPGSDRSWLQTQGVEFAEGDVTDPASLQRAFEGVEVVYHSAARVGDWGPWPEFQAITIDGTRNMVEAAAQARVRRFLHISSISVYGYHTKPGTIDESYDLGFGMYRWAYYTRSKVAAEQLAWDYHQAGKIALSVIRPSWLYGPRDRTSIARQIRMVQRGRAKFLGQPDNRLNMVYAGNVAEASILAVDKPEAAGQAYNCSNDGDITQQQFWDMLAKAVNAPPVKTRVPYWGAYTAAFLLECMGHLTKSRKPPFITRYAVWLMGRRAYFSAEKARRELGWKPTVTYEVGIPLTVKWYFEHVGH